MLFGIDDRMLQYIWMGHKVLIFIGRIGITTLFFHIFALI